MPPDFDNAQVCRACRHGFSFTERRSESGPGRALVRCTRIQPAPAGLGTAWPIVPADFRCAAWAPERGAT
jgi:hypothetical protein